MNVCGIDPGKTGGYGIFNSITGALLSAGPLKFDDPKDLFDSLERWNVIEILLERAQAAPGDANGFEYGRSFGRTEAACFMSGAKIYYCGAAWWKARLNVPTDKTRAYGMALKRWPALEFFAPPGPRGGLDAVHGTAEACLIGSILCDDTLMAELVKNNAARVKPKRRKPRYDWPG